MNTAAPADATAAAFRATILLAGKTATGIRVPALALDTAPRVVVVPDDFAQALAQNTTAQDFFNALSYSNKQRFVLSIEGAKTSETRQRRIAKAVVQLREERA